MASIERVREVAPSRKNFTATTSLESTNGGDFMGVFVASSTGGTIKVADTQGTIVNTTSVSAGTYYPIPVRWYGTLTITVGGTLDATAFYG